jgi:hypothetical protein
VRKPKWQDPPNDGVDHLGLEFSNLAAFFGIDQPRIKDHAVALAETKDGIYVVSQSGAVTAETEVGHRGPFPTEDTALVYLALVKD